MIRNFDEILAEAKRKETVSIVTPDPQSKRVLAGINKAKVSGLIEPILIGNGRLIEENLSSLKMDTDRWTIIDEEDTSRALGKAIKMVGNREADMISSDNLVGMTR